MASVEYILDNTDVRNIIVETNGLADPAEVCIYVRVVDQAVLVRRGVEHKGRASFDNFDNFGEEVPGCQELRTVSETNRLCE